MSFFRHGVLSRTLAAGLLLVLAACGGGGNDRGRFAFTMSLVGLPDSTGLDGHYELWVVQNGVAVSAGKFLVNGVGPSAAITNLAGDRQYGTAMDCVFGPSITLLGEDFPRITAASHLFITLEPNGDDNLVPSCQVILAGVVQGNTASLTAAGVSVDSSIPCAQPDGAGGFHLGLGDFSTASGSFQFMSPTDNLSNPVNNDFAGVWFLQPAGAAITEGASAGDTPSLVLPVLRGGLRYEAWAVVDGTPRSLGTFVDPNGPDSDAMTALQRGPDGPGPRVPGGDFVVDYIPPFAIDPPMMSLVTTANFMDGDYRTFITIEPHIDNDPGPFQLRILEALIPPDATTSDRAAMNVAMNSLFAGLPSATATLGAADIQLSNNTLQQLSGATMSDRRGHFALWVDDGVVPQLAGRFWIEGTTLRAVDTGTVLGDTTSATFDAASVGLGVFPPTSAVTSVFITLEDEGDRDAQPSERVILEGAVTGGVATLTVAGSTSQGGRGLADFSGADGLFHLSTPSDNLAGSGFNDSMGIQFRTLGVARDVNAVGLTLPVLNQGWCYEGWVEDRLTGRLFSTGRFGDPALPDSDHGTSLSEGPETKFALPGKGFLNDVMVATRLAAGANSITEVFITIESSPDDSSAPSSFRVLEATVSGPGFSFVMQNVFPDATNFRADMSYSDGD